MKHAATDGIIEEIGTSLGVPGLSFVDEVKGARHKVIKVRDRAGQYYALRTLIKKEPDISYFNQSFKLSRECAVLADMEAHGVFVPHVIGQKNLHEKGHYALLSWLEGEHLSLRFKEHCTARNHKKLIEIMNALAKLFYTIHSIKFSAFGEIGTECSKQTSATDFLLACIRQHSQNETFVNCYGGDISKLNQKAEYLANQIQSHIAPSLVIYDLHGDNMIVNDAGIFLFDVDYAHAGASTFEFIPIFHDLIGRYVPVGDELRDVLRTQLIQHYKELGGAFHEELEPLVALNHFVVSMIKLNYRSDATAKEKIGLYDVEIQNLVETGDISYPQMIWPGDV